MLQNLQNFANVQKIQLDNLVDFEKCCKTHIYLQRSAPTQPKTSEILPKVRQKLATTRSGSTRVLHGLGEEVLELRLLVVGELLGPLGGLLVEPKFFKPIFC